MTRHTLTVRNVGIALLVLIAALAGATAPAVAQDSGEDEFLDGLLSDTSGTFSAAKAALSGVNARLSHLFGEESNTSPSAIAEDVRVYFNSNGRAGEFQSYVNNRTTADSNQTVLAITYKPEGEDGPSATHYLTSDVNNSEYRNASIVSSYSGTPDEECTLRKAAARNAKSDLKAFYKEFVTTDKDVTKQYLIQKRVEYAGMVSCSFLDGGGD